MHHIRTLAAIRDHLPRELACRLCTSLVISRLDYCNSVLSGVPKCSLRPLQLALNMAARLAFKAKGSCHISPLLEQLQWLPIEKRIEEKILTLVFLSAKLVSTLAINARVPGSNPTIDGYFSTSLKALG